MSGEDRKDKNIEREIERETDGVDVDVWGVIWRM